MKLFTVFDMHETSKYHPQIHIQTHNKHKMNQFTGKNLTNENETKKSLLKIKQKFEFIIFSFDMMVNGRNNGACATRSNIHRWLKLTVAKTCIKTISNILALLVCIPPHNIIHNPHFSQPTIYGRRIVYISVPMQSTVIRIQVPEEKQQHQRFTLYCTIVFGWRIIFQCIRLGSEHALGVRQTKRNRIGEFENWTDESNDEMNKRFAGRGLEKMHNVMALNECVVCVGWVECWQFAVASDARWSSCEWLFKHPNSL